MNLNLIIKILLITLGALTIFYGLYYFINPSRQGEYILKNLGIPHPVVIAHRGASIIAPESTAPAYKIARDHGSDYLEADLQRTKDGEIIVFHDAYLTRTTNVEEVFPERQDEEIGEFTLEELRQLDVGSWFNDKNPGRARPVYENQRILTLAELIDIARSGQNTPGLILELKHPEKYPGLSEDIVNILIEKEWLAPHKISSLESVSEEYNINKNGFLQARPTEASPEKMEASFPKTIFFSFSVDKLEKLKNLVPEVPRVLLISDNMISRRSWEAWLDQAEHVAHGLGPKGFMSWPWYIASAHERNLFVLPYTINHLWQVKILAQIHTSGYITDRPDLVLNFLDRIPDPPEINQIFD